MESDKVFSPDEKPLTAALDLGGQPLIAYENLAGTYFSALGRTVELTAARHLDDLKGELLFVFFLMRTLDKFAKKEGKSCDT